MELCLDTDGKKKLRYIDYFMHRISLLQHYEITPVVVLDGGHMPCKAATGDERQRQVSPLFNHFFFSSLISFFFIHLSVFVLFSIIRKRKANFDAAMVKLKEGNVKAAVEFFQVRSSSHFKGFVL